jgi:hypothetical protein
MRKNWPYLVVASFLNTLLVTATFLEFKLRGLAVIDWPAGTPVPAWYDMDPVQFAGGMFVLSLLLMIVIIGIKNLVTRIFTKLNAPQPPKGEDIRLHLPTVSLKF